MAEQSQKSWKKYAVGSHAKHSDCQSLDRVLHVTHVHSALAAIRERKLSPRLIYDESRLNTERVLVSWLSPNHWGPGFRYGNIAFSLDWSSLAEGMKWYWVGVMRYSPQACRILITDQDHPELLPYDPFKRDGPWWCSKKTGKHYWNGEYCLEFMLEDSISFSDVAKLEFVDHHRYQCSISAGSCPDRGHDASTGAARLLAGAADRGLLTNADGLWIDAKSKPKESLRYAWPNLRAKISFGMKERWTGSLDGGCPQAKAVARAAMGNFCDLNNADRKEMLSLFDARESAIEAMATLIEEDLDIKSNTLSRS